MRSFIDIVFDGSEDSEDCVLVEVEDEHGRSIRAGEWVKRPDGYHALRLRPDVFEQEDPTPYCSYGHQTKGQCDCGPIAANE